MLQLSCTALQTGMQPPMNVTHTFSSTFLSYTAVQIMADVWQSVNHNISRYTGHIYIAVK